MQLLPLTTMKRKLHKKLWKLFSKFIRKRDKYICFTCDRYEYPSQAGHYRTGATCKKYLFFDERNVHSQCYHCNINLSGNWPEYQKRMWIKYGKKIDKEFDKINQRDGWDYPYQEMIDKYKNLCQHTRVQYIQKKYHWHNIIVFKAEATIDLVVFVLYT